MQANKSLVLTTTGPVQGALKTSLLNTEYYSFQGIPYAQPPVGELRFRAPKPVEPWTDILDASIEGPACWSFNPTTKQLAGNEDCLHLNVYTKDITLGTGRPVMVYIHGGAFMWGSSSTEIYGPDYLMQKDVVLVTLNYRLGAFGFLTIDDPVCQVPGNAGLKDQALALKWINKNAHIFGGDPNNITLFGESAGGCSVHFHMLSDWSKGLFHKAIMMSGSALNNWSIVDCANMAQRLALQLGWNGKGGIADAFGIIKMAKPEDITMGQESVLTNDELKRHVLFSFGPCVEPYLSEACMIPQKPMLMAREAWGRAIPLLIGGTSEDGLYLYRITLDRPEALDEARADMGTLVPLELELQLGEEKCTRLGASLKEFYFGSEEPSMKTLMRYIELGTDKWFLHGLHRTVLGRLSGPKTTSATYLYRFNFDSSTFNHYKLQMCGKDVKGACHADDLSYLFRNTFVSSIDTESIEFKTILRMVGIWTKFATTGEPNDELIKPLIWTPLTDVKSGYKCLNISDDLTFIDFPERERMEFWDSMYERDQIF